MVEGITTIELTDVNTGEVEKIESKNMVTNAVRDLFQNPVYCDEKRLKDHQPFYYTVFGGLVCFDTPLEENANKYFAPLTAETIASAAMDFKNTYDDTIRGSYNSIESEMNQTEKYVKYVYDFTTQQGNGIIRSVCLTPRWAGYGLSTVGVSDDQKLRNKYNNVSAEFHTFSKEFSDSFSYCSVIRGADRHRQFYFLDLEKQKAIGFEYAVWRENDRDNNYVEMHCDFNMYERRIYTKNAPSIFESKNQNETYLASYHLDLSKLLSLIPESVKQNYPDKIKSLINNHDTYRTSYLFGVDYNNKNKIHIILVFDVYDSPSPCSLNHFTLNLLNGDIEYLNSNTFNYRDFGYYHAVHDSNDNMYGAYSSPIYPVVNNILYMNRNNNIEQINLNNLTTDIFKEGFTLRGIDIKNHFFVFSTDNNKNQYVSSFNGSYQPTIVSYYDYINDKIKYTYANFPFNRNELAPILFDETNPLFIIFPTNTYDDGTVIFQLGYRNSFLSTINNLPEPIEKTQDKTMKITYTLREV